MSTKVAYGAAKTNPFTAEVFLQHILVYHLMVAILGMGDKNALNNLADYIDDLRYHCSHTPLCQSNTSDVLNMNLARNATPCCRPCSCEPDCGLKKICCFDKDDRYKRGEEDCILTELGDGRKTSLRYYVIQNCTNGDNICQDDSLAPWGSMFPVFSPKTELIYLNSKCASCNGIYDTIPWNIEFYCEVTFHLQHSVSEEIRALLSGHLSESCFMMFIPPKHVDVTDLSCNHEVVRECFVYTNREELNVSDAITSLCSSFNATFIVSDMFPNKQTRFGNVFCAMCNVKDIAHESVCADLPYVLRSPFTPVVTGLLSGVKSRQLGTEAPLVCRGSDSHPEAVCKPLVCPEGQIRTEKDCQFYVSLWGEKYAVFVRLTPRDNRSLLPVSYLTALTGDNLMLGHWLYRDTLQHWQPIIYYRLAEEQTHIKFLVVGLYVETDIELAYVLKDINRALRSTWVAVFEENRYYYNVELNRFTKYRQFNNRTYYPMYDPFQMKSTHEVDEHVIILTKEIYKYKSPNYVYLTQFYFCNQIDLFPSEYLELENSVYLKINNVTLRKTDYRAIDAVDGTSRLRVCVEKWLIGARSHASQSIERGCFFYVFFAFGLYLLTLSDIFKKCIY